MVRLAVVVIAVVSLAAASNAAAAFPGENGRIAVGFSGGCIKTMKPDGTGLRGLIGCERFTRTGVMPEWSPDGRRLLFLRTDATMPFDQLGHPALMAADGSRQRLVRLAPEPPFLYDSKPSFAPDGRQFLFTRGPSSGAPRPEIWKATTAGRGERRLRAGWLPRWSPDGATIAYVHPMRYAGRTGLVNARTGKRIRWVAPEVSSLDWSPDGRWLVYSPSVCCPDVYTDLFAVRADGQGPRRRLTRTRRWAEGQAVWSPNGRRIAFVRWLLDEGGEFARYQILTMNRAGSDRRLIYDAGDMAIEEIDLDSGITLSWGPRRG
jgi:Tol biopolymer transport system component